MVLPRLLLILFLSTVSHIDARADARAGEKKAQLCLLCHRANTQYGAGIPLLEGRPAKDLVAAIMEFKSGKRSDPAMQPNVERLTPRDIADIADYFASRPAAAKPAPGPTAASSGQLRIDELRP